MFTPVKAAAETGSEMLSGTFQLPTAAVHCCVFSFTMRIMLPPRAEASPTLLTPKGTQTACQLWVLIHRALVMPHFFAESIGLAGLLQQGKCKEEGQGTAGWWQPMADVRG